MLIPVVVLVLCIFASCGKGDDDESTMPDNYFIVNGKTYELKMGYLQNYGTDPEFYEGYNLDLTLVSDGFTVDLANFDFTGTGDALYFEMFSSSADMLPAGDYTFDSSELPPVGAFDYGECLLNFNASTGESTSSSEITGGKVSVSKNGSIYEITINCTTASGKTITGYFKGALTFMDFDSVLMSRTLPSTPGISKAKSRFVHL